MKRRSTASGRLSAPPATAVAAPAKAATAVTAPTKAAKAAKRTTTTVTAPKRPATTEQPTAAKRTTAAAVTTTAEEPATTKRTTAAKRTGTSGLTAAGTARGRARNVNGTATSRTCTGGWNMSAIQPTWTAQRGGHALPGKSLMRQRLGLRDVRLRFRQHSLRR